mmetsp:Transcript_32710/g.80597  ORF Transcript_32710/g.80597 Transcript_32710/m.80597 type:complete len:269 (+) Transcript_32710:151-957(+)|eukprot:CAMPEP_0197576762 /NCGR_PEP_ID=MMETSP1326-20131121/1659_1 /TAXON_ID=1155430 /ORGANISM="Genus nov. species nov., Strain RCC2288" /LENGTH=268 /DNA_ID=CAMNT_0043139727 /DNA_START=148 /DNA_END=954 /DNA_ORIENTATION=-
MAASEDGSAKEIVMKIVAPSLGFVLANVMFFSGVPAMLRCKRAGGLGDMNPMPFPVVMANCLAWIAYSLIIEDYFLFFSNAPGCMVGVYFTLVAYGLSPFASKMRDALEQCLMGMVFALLALTLYVGIVARDEPTAHKKTTVGLFANAVLLVYYAAPLSTVKEVLATRNSKSLYFPIAVANTVNGTAWFVYGLALEDPYIYAPNAVGATLGVLQIGLIVMFPGAKHDTSPAPSTMGSTSDLLMMDAQGVVEGRLAPGGVAAGGAEGRV